MLGCPWPEARARMEAIFADRLPDDVDGKTLRALCDGYEPSGGDGVGGGDGAENAASREPYGGESPAGGRVPRGKPALRASQVIRKGLWMLRKGGYIGRSVEFGGRVAGMLPAMFPRPGMKSLRLCAALDWRLPGKAA